jgi:hypothetical protein
VLQPTAYLFHLSGRLRAGGGGYGFSGGAAAVLVMFSLLIEANFKE